MSSLSVTLNWSGEEERLVEVVAKVRRGPNPASEVANYNEIVPDAVNARDTAPGDQREADSPVERGEDRGAVEGNYRGVMGVNRFDASCALGRLG